MEKGKNIIKPFAMNVKSESYSSFFFFFFIDSLIFIFYAKQ